MKHLLKTFTLLLAFVGSTYAQTDRFVTLTAKSVGGALATNSVAISEVETAHVETFTYDGQSVASYVVSKDNIEITTCNGCYGTPLPTLKGPATITLRAYNNGGAMLSLRISPESFDPNKTLILPPKHKSSRNCT